MRSKCISLKRQNGSNWLTPNHSDQIFFDGNLENWKIATREQRLQQAIEDRKEFRRSHAEEFNLSSPSDTGSYDPKKLLNTESTASSPRDSSTVPFLVPAVIESLCRSKFASITRLVPGEAEAYCAIEMGTLILTNDTDCLLYDREGCGAVAFLDDLRLSSGHVEFRSENRRIFHECDDHDPGNPTTLIAKLFLPPKIAERLKVPSLLHVAAVLSDHPCWSLPQILSSGECDNVDIAKHFAVEEQEGRRSAHQYDPSVTFRIYHRTDGWELGRWHRRTTMLDPRLSEFTFGLANTNTSLPATYYTVPLLEDPARKSAWEVGALERKLAFMILGLTCTPLKMEKKKIIQEKTRKGDRLIATSWDMDRIEMELELYLLGTNLIDRLEHARKQLTGVPAHDTFYWRAFGIIGLNSSRKDQEDGKRLTKKRIDNLVTGASNGGTWSWDVVHDFARVEAFLYSLRILKQAVDYVVKHLSLLRNTGQIREESGVKIIRKLHRLLFKMPDLARLVPSRMELQKSATSAKASEFMPRVLKAGASLLVDE